MRTYVRHIQKNKIAHLSAILSILTFSIFYSLTLSPNTRADDSIIFRLSVTSSSDCFNGIDDDNDGFIDTSDSECIGPADRSEASDNDAAIQAFMTSFPNIVEVVHSKVLGTSIRFR